jgi:nicotinamidase-related amidase
MNNALIIVDVWDTHWDKSTKHSLNTLASDINAFAIKARNNGDLVIHAPSGVINKKKLPTNSKYNLINKNKLHDQLIKLNFPMILDANGSPNWTKPHPNIDINESDYVTGNGSEIFNLLKKYDIRNLYYCGVHANICILWTRTFSILQMQNNGINAALIQDLSMSLPNKKYNELLSFYKKHICDIKLKEQIYA